MAARITEADFDSAVLQKKGTVVVDFYSDSCVPCKKLSPVLAALEEEKSDVSFVKVNTNYDSGLAEKYAVESTPTLIFFRDGSEQKRTTGAVKKEEITDIINSIG